MVNIPKFERLLDKGAGFWGSTVLEHFDRFEDVLEMTSCKRGDARCYLCVVRR